VAWRRTGRFQRVGINFGAPGDRRTEDGTLWLEWPVVGGLSPDVRRRGGPDQRAAILPPRGVDAGGAGWPWVYASGISGVRTVRLDTIARAAPASGAGFSARWTGFVETDRSETNTFQRASDGTVAPLV